MDFKQLREGDEIVYIGTECACCEQGKTYTVFMHDGHPRIRCNGTGAHKSDPDPTFHTLMEGQNHMFKRFIQHKGGWIGVDLDATLCVYEKWEGPYVLGAPIPKMVERVKKWLAEGRDVRIFTARMTDVPFNNDGTVHDLAVERASIEAWCVQHLGQVLPITNVKDWNMMELWDDRAVQVKPNTGETLADELAAIREAERTPKLGS
jgi:hypothetical protein